METESVEEKRMAIYELFVKRAIDIWISSFLLILTLPISVVIGIAIRIDSSGPILFRQTRSGLKGKDFTLYKFRSMTARNNVYDASQSDEITRVGKFIRRTSIDEIPQLINVLKGEMSLIGPRPWLPEYYASMNSEQRRRYDVRPGITGLAQARGRNALTIFDKIDCDLEYVRKISLIGDIKIAFLTLKTMFDESSLEIGKMGISDELKILKEKIQNLTSSEENDLLTKLDDSNEKK